MSEVKRRGGHRAECRKLVDAIKAVDTTGDIDNAKIIRYKTELSRQRELILKLDESIQSSDSDKFDFEKDISESSEVQMMISDGVEICDKLMAGDVSKKSHTNNAKLPTITLPMFNGSVLDWGHFWDLYESSIHNREDLSDSSKFHYLRTQLTGEAAQLLSGFNYTRDEYLEAVDLLKTTYGNTKRLIEAHLHSILDAKSPNATASDLRKFRSLYEGHLRGLRSLNADIDSAGYVYATILLRKLPSKVRDNINREGRSNFWDLVDLRKAIEQEIGHLEANEYSKQSCEENSAYGTMSMTVSTKNSSQMKTHNCVFCDNESHLSVSCSKYKTVDQRRDIILRKRLCFNCLKSSHISKDCRSYIRCRKCHRKHHSAICTSDDPNDDTERWQTPRMPSDYEGPTTSMTGSTSTSSTILPTALVNLVTEIGSEHTRALIDLGSQRTFIHCDMVRKLQLKSVGSVNLSINGFGGLVEMKKYNLVKFLVESSIGFIETEAVVVSCFPKVINMPGRSEAMKNLKGLGLKLADDIDSSDNLSIGLLIGCDQCFKFLYSNRVGDLSLLPSNLGTIIAGSLTQNIEQTSCITVLRATDSNEVRLDEKLKQFWDLESIGITENSVENLDYDRLVEFKDGKFIASLPWRSDHRTLPDNYFLAKNRLKRNLISLRKSPNTLFQYNDIINTQIERDFIEKVNNPDEFEGKVHYISHHGIVKDSVTTPLKIVYDCSARKSKESPSLNDCLMSGPSLINDLLSVFIRFRAFKHACISDIEKAYLMVGLNERDRDSTRFLWPDDPYDLNSSIGVYRFKVVFFGGTCSQFLLNLSIKKLLDSYSDIQVAKEIRSSLYVDNLAFSAREEQKVLEFYNSSTSLLNSAGFTLREWVTNSDLVKGNISEASYTKSGDETNVLGFMWNVENDSLGFKVKDLSKEVTCTKRSVVSDSSKIFDPIGLLSPVSVRCKIFIQRLWKNELEWDEELPSTLVDEWNSIVSDLSYVQGMKWERNLDLGKVSKLYIFCDSSKVAYGAVCYIFTESGIKFLMAKSRIAPVKTVTLPQLELTSANIGARLAKYLIDILKDICEVTDVIFFSDSQIALSWILNKNSNKQYVNQRVTNIHELVPGAVWRYVTTLENPADHLTRGLTASELLNSNWITGPEWLNSFDCFQNYEIASNTVIDQTEFVVDIHCNDVICNEVVECGLSEDYFLRFSSFIRLIRVTAYIYRFINWKTNKESSFELTSDELKFSERALILIVQRIFFAEIFSYQSDSTLPVPSIVKQLDIICIDGILHCKGRLIFSELELESKYPILLPSRSYLCKLLIWHFHDKIFHSGVSQTLATVRERYWIPRGRQVIKSVLRRCVTCKRINSRKEPLPSVAPLPYHRVVSSEPFSTTGVDYAGPLLVRDCGETRKVYICLFTCMITRAIFLELAHDGTADTFLLCFRRFTARMSVPKLLLSDNAPIFVKTADLLKQIKAHEKVVSKLNLLNVEWQFIPVNAPHFGGAWERMVGLTKNSLRKVLGKSLISSIELSTLLCEIESLINDRPITYVSDDITDDPLTPSHLVCGRRIRALGNAGVDLTLLSDPNVYSREMFTRKQLRLRKLLQDLWYRWKSEYLTSLRERSSNNLDVPSNLRAGDVVLIADGNSRSSWKLGKIVTLNLGNDGVVRSAYIKTKNGFCVQPIINMVNLEISSSASDFENVNEPSCTRERIKRKAAVQANLKIKESLK